jgi:hypothetical protein
MLQISFDSEREIRVFKPNPSRISQNKDQKYSSIAKALMAWINIIIPWPIDEKLYLHGGAVLHILFGEKMPLNDFDFMVNEKMIKEIARKIGFRKMLPLKCGDYIFELENVGKVECGVGTHKNIFIKLNVTDTITNISYQVEIMEKNDVAIDFYLNSIQIEYSLKDSANGIIKLSKQQLQDIWCFTNNKPIYSLQFSFLSSIPQTHHSHRESKFSQKIFHKVFYRLLKILEKNCNVFGVKDLRKMQDNDSDHCPVCYVSSLDSEIELKKIHINCCPNNHHVCMCCLLKLQSCPLCRQNISFSHLEHQELPSDFAINLIRFDGEILSKKEEREEREENHDIQVLLPKVSLHRKISWNFMHQMLSKQDVESSDSGEIEPFVNNARSQQCEQENEQESSSITITQRIGRSNRITTQRAPDIEYLHDRRNSLPDRDNDIY